MESVWEHGASGRMADGTQVLAVALRVEGIKMCGIWLEDGLGLRIKLGSSPDVDKSGGFVHGLGRNGFPKQAPYCAECSLSVEEVCPIKENRT